MTQVHNLNEITLFSIRFYLWKMKFLQGNQALGIGSGSTIVYAVERIGKLENHLQ